MFQFTRPRGARPLGFLRCRKGYNPFQFTRPRGARHCSSVILCFLRLFQFTRPRGARHLFHCRTHQRYSVSIHAPARGATERVCLMNKAIIVSIHAPARGATFNVCHLCLNCLVSIHAPARGATACACRRRRDRCVSIHAPARGATILRQEECCAAILFQFTRPRGARLYCVFSLLFCGFSMLFLRKTVFYFHYCLPNCHFFRNLLYVNMCEYSAVFCALRVRSA